MTDKYEHVLSTDLGKIAVRRTLPDVTIFWEISESEVIISREAAVSLAYMLLDILELTERESR